MLDSRMYLINGKIEFESGKVVLEFADENGEINKIPDLEEYVKAHGTNLNSSIAQPINGDIGEFLKENLTSYLNMLIEKKLIKIPPNKAKRKMDIECNRGA